MFNAIAQVVFRALSTAKNQFVQAHQANLICDVRQIGDVVPLWDPGVCDAFVMEWFRRIYAGRPTWRHRREIVNGEKVTVWSREPVDWKNKAPRLQRLQHDFESYGSDQRFGFTVMPPLDHPERQELLFGVADGAYSAGDAMAAGRRIWEAISALREANTTDEHLFFGLRVGLGSYGHMIGLHLRRDLGLGARVPEDIDPRLLHLFDPNVGELKASGGDRRAMFIGELLGMYGDRVKSYSVSHVKVWWGRGESGKQPFRHAAPETPDQGDEDDF